MELIDVPSTSQETLFCTVSQPPIRIFCVAGEYFVVTRKEAEIAENEARVALTYVSDESELSENDNRSHPPPYSVLPELVVVLVEFGFARVLTVASLECDDLHLDSSTKSEENGLSIEELDLPDSIDFHSRRLTARDFWRKGYFVASGARFGGDLLAYMGSPNRVHAEFVILCSSTENVAVSSLISAARVCSQVRKKLVLSVVRNSYTPYYLHINWFRPELYNEGAVSRKKYRKNEMEN